MALTRAASAKLIAATRVENNIRSLVFVVNCVAVQPCPLLHTDACVCNEGDWYGHVGQPGLDMIPCVAQLGLYGSSPTPPQHNQAVTAYF